MTGAETRKTWLHAALLAPAAAFFLAFWLLPMLRLVEVGASGPQGIAAYWLVLSNENYLRSLLYTLGLSALVTAATLVVACITGLFLERNDFPGRSLLVAVLTFPLAFPGVVVGFLIILLCGRQGLLGDVTLWLIGEKLVLAYTLPGLFLGYLYFSIPRVILTVMAAAEKLDPALVEAARILGANPWQILRDVTVPALTPALVSSGAICFATSIGAFGTAFTLATNITVLPMTIYGEFTNYANLSVAAALSIVLGLVTWLVLAAARSFAGATAAAAA